eukprot:GEZU01002049.1.p1 GENE.GEZU01002049.1~~GEZU01002049.1.p1  ORF type:complete len:376 (+),score=66.65 GEZU01002049.1:1151-2278(+)
MNRHLRAQLLKTANIASSSRSIRSSNNSSLRSLHLSPSNNNSKLSFLQKVLPLYWPSTDSSDDEISGAKIIDGIARAKEIRSALNTEVSDFKRKFNVTPGIGIVLVGNRPESRTYVRNKVKALQEVGMNVDVIHMPDDDDVDNEKLKFIVRSLNIREDIHGILVQLPLPAQLNQEEILQEVKIEKDVDGLHPLIMGKLAMSGHDHHCAPCTAMACLDLIKSTGESIAGKRAVVIGKSNVVGLPTALALNKNDATVSLCHIKTPNTADVAREADILVAAAGVPHLVQRDWVKPGAIVIDVGINFIQDAITGKRRLVGDVAFDEVSQVAGHITPVPGGVGPMTVTMLLLNTFNAARRMVGLNPIDSSHATAVPSLVQ